VMCRNLASPGSEFPRRRGNGFIVRAGQSRVLCAARDFGDTLSRVTPRESSHSGPFHHAASDRVQTVVGVRPSASPGHG